MYVCLYRFESELNLILFAPYTNLYCTHNIGTGYVPAVLLVLAGSLTPVAKVKFIYPNILA